MKHSGIARRTLLLGGGAALAGCSGRLHGYRRRVGFAVVNERLLIHGKVTRRTLREFTEVMEQNPQITTLVLQDMPGTGGDTATIALGHDVRARGLVTVLQSDSSIAAGAVALFLAGTQRRMVEGAEIGLTSWSDGGVKGRELPRGDPAHASRRQYVQDMLGTDAFYWFALQAAPEDEIHKMTAQEIAHHGLLTEPVKVWN
ncbi:alpha/beta hydrolase [Sulfitobacter sp.]|uniref:alpha/beta hydrolase n=1 Tax=Sulfitobacter sp. TaxID=1903071 RepID=UPI00300245A6